MEAGNFSSKEKADKEQSGGTTTLLRRTTGQTTANQKLISRALSAQDGRDGGPGRSADRRRRSKSRKRRKKKKKSRKKKTRGNGGDDPSEGDGDDLDGSSYFSSSAEGCRGRSGGSKSESESDSDMLPPLKRRASKREGFVLELLLQQVAEQMDAMEKMETQEERVLEGRQRRGTLCLEDRGIAASTRARYFTAVRKVLPLLESNYGTEDDIISSWIEECYMEGEAITSISDTLSGLHHFAPHLRGHLGKSWRLFRLWRRIEKPAQAPPLPEGFLTAMVSRALELGQLDLAVAMALGFWGMLRTGELMSLFPFQILWGSNNAIVQLGATKSGMRRNQDENVMIEHGPTLLLLQTWLDIRRHNGTFHAPAFLAGPPAFREDFRKILRFFKLESIFRPYSLRRGGATHDFRSHGQMERTLIRGRWASNVAARQYIQEGMSVLVTLKLRETQAQLLQRYATMF
eukprot:Skav236466  [mRNA]  locus=scaffold2130:88860:94224:+ [translate_table: standard]